eukprot:SAG22_NODE_1944_length_3283_cov_13.320666_1_plen_191_part_10
MHCAAQLPPGNSRRHREPEAQFRQRTMAAHLGRFILVAAAAAAAPAPAAPSSATAAPSSAAPSAAAGTAPSGSSRRPAPAAPATDQTVPRGPTNNTDMKASGPSYNHTFVKHTNKTAGALACQATCDAAPRCYAWTYVPYSDAKAGPEAAERCCLFPRRGCPVARQGVVSGARTAGPCAGPHPPPHPHPPP